MRSNSIEWVSPDDAKKLIGEKVNLCGSLHQVGLLLGKNKAQVYRWYSGDQMMNRESYDEIKKIKGGDVWATWRSAKTEINRVHKIVKSMRQVAFIAGVDPAVINKIFKGERKMKLCSLEKLRSYCG